MQPDYSFEALRKFIEVVREKGLHSKATAQGWQVATGKVLGDLEQSALQDVRTIDVEVAVRRFANRNPGTLSPKSLGEYQRRVTQVIQEFVDWTDNPVAYRPKGSTTQQRRKETSAPSTAQPPRRAPETKPERLLAATPSAPNPTQSLSLNFPLRPDFLAQVVIPRDLKADEARRLGAFLATLAIDYASAS